MSGVLFVVAVVAAASICPAMMWWNARRGRQASCMPKRSAAEPDELREVRDQQAAIADRLAALGGDQVGNGVGGESSS
jgi:hypothetical protein